MLKYSKPVTDDYNNSFWTYEKALAKLVSGDANPMMTLVHTYCQRTLYDETPDEHMTKALEWIKTINPYHYETLKHSIKTQELAMQVNNSVMKVIKSEILNWSANKSKSGVNGLIESVTDTVLLPRPDETVTIESLFLYIKRLLDDEELNRRDTSLLSVSVNIADNTTAHECCGDTFSDKMFGLIFEIHYLDEEGGDSYNHRFRGFSYVEPNVLTYSDTASDLLTKDLISLDGKLESLIDLLTQLMSVFMVTLINQTSVTHITESKLQRLLNLYYENMIMAFSSEIESDGGILLIDNTSTILNTVDGAKYGLYTGRY